jgi:Tol biopolymer transport system component
VIVFSPGPNSPLQRVAAAGGEASLVSKNDDPQASYRFPEFLPDGRHFLLLVSSNKSENAGIYVGSLDGTPRIRLRPEASSASYTPSSAGRDGLLLFRKDDTLMAQPFDPANLKTKGDIFAVTEQVGEAGNTGFGAFSVSDAGVLAHATGQVGTVRELAWVDRKGKRMDTVTKPAPMGDFALAPDEKRAVMRLDDKNNTSDFWLQDLSRGTLSRFTFGAQSVTSAVWSPDGNRTAYAASPASSFSYDLYQKAAGGGKEELLAHAGVNARPTDWSRDGKSIVFVVLGEKPNYDLWLLPVDSAGGKPAAYVQTPFSERAARFSPDGHYMAYESDESGQYEVYVQPIPASGAKWQVSNAGGRQPTWRSDGKELYFIAGQKLIAVSAKTDTSGFQAGTAEPLFDGLRADDFDSVYQPSANGQRFLVRFAAGDVNSAAPTTIVLNWQTGVKK